MQGSHVSPPEVLIAMRRFRAHAPGFVAAARRVGRSFPGLTMAIDAFHREKDDIGLLRVHMAAGTAEWQVAALIVQAMSEGMEAVETSRMSSERWRWYVHNHLPTFKHMAHADTMEAAVGLMAERMPTAQERRRLARGTILRARPASPPPRARHKHLVARKVQRRPPTMRDSESAPVCVGEVDTDRFQTGDL
jgi:hypothetical protein